MKGARILSVVLLAFAVVYYLVAVTGLLWPATPPLDVGIVSTTAIFALLGGLGLLVTQERPTSQ